MSVGDLRKRPLPDAEFLFPGSGNYDNRPGDETWYLFRDGTFTGRKLALFATAGSEDCVPLLRDMAEDITKKGEQILGEPDLMARQLLSVTGTCTRKTWRMHETGPGILPGRYGPDTMFPPALPARAQNSSSANGSAR
ncbi:MAG TPA: hypothetical protein VHN82_01520 [Methanoregula sp.]|nr:hypothetical protein [Methanoregula sp.]